MLSNLPCLSRRADRVTKRGELALEGKTVAKGIIYQVDGSGNLTKMIPGKPASEDEIQKLIAEHPEMVTGIDEPLLLIRREAPIPDRIDGQGRWSLDHLFVARDGKPVLVEVKQATNTQLRREVIGQILEYGANAAFYWGKGRLAQAFFARFEQEEEAQQALDAFLRSDGIGADALEVGNPTSFWERVEANLQSGVLKLVIVSDQIPRELARIVEFLNEQMMADVQAVELRWYTAAGGLTALVPNIIGATERAAERKIDVVVQPPNEYWLDLKDKYPQLVTGKAWRDASQDFFSLRTGNPKIVIGCKFVKNELRVYVYFDYGRAKDAYAVILEKQDVVNRSYDQPLVWDNMPNYNAARIMDILPNVDRFDRADWQRQHDWLNERAMKLAEVIKPLIPDVELRLKQSPTLT
jgi:hypothetical protein